MTTAISALTAVTDASVALTLALSDLPPDALLSTLQPQFDALSRAISRVIVTAAMHPDLRADDAMPRHSMTPEDKADRIMSVTLLEAAATLPSSTCKVTLRAEPLHDDSIEDAVRSFVDGQVITAVPAGLYLSLDIAPIVSEIVDRFLPRDEEEPIMAKKKKDDDGEEYDVDIATVEPPTKAQLRLQRRFGPREKGHK
jgi:hypothetical protein